MDYRVGSIIEYTPYFGGTRRVEVTNKVENIKGPFDGFDGRLIPLFDYDAEDDEDFDPRFLAIPQPEFGWGLDSQITKVVEF